MIKCPWIVTLVPGHSGFVLPSTFMLRHFFRILQSILRFEF
jgi:hypothetical protein